MKKYKVIGLFVLFFSITSCLEHKKEKNKLINPESIVKLNISNELFNKNSDYSNFIGSVEVIKLETNANSLIGNIRKIEFQNNKFYVLDRSEVLFIFDEAGNYLNKLNKKGKGPGEYLEMRDFFVNKDGFIKVLTYRGVLTYDSNLTFIDQKAIKVKSDDGREIHPICFLPNNDITFFYLGSFGIRNIVPGKDNALYCINNKNKIINEYLPVFSRVTGGHQHFYRSNDVVLFTNTYGNDTIYQIQENYLVPKVYINFFKKKIAETDMMGNRGIYYNTIIENELCGNLINVYENNDYLCFMYNKGRNLLQGVFNKKTQEIKILNMNYSLPLPFIKVDGLCNDFFFTTIDPNMLFYESGNIIINDFISTFNLSDLKETDNPIIVKFKFKF